MKLLSANGNLGMPFPQLLVPVYASNARRVAPILSTIVAVNLRRHVAQIARAVVGLNAIDVVNVSLRPFAMGQRPNHPVSQEVFTQKPPALVARDIHGF